MIHLSSSRYLKLERREQYFPKVEKDFILKPRLRSSKIDLSRFLYGNFYHGEYYGRRSKTIREANPPYQSCILCWLSI